MSAQLASNRGVGRAPRRVKVLAAEDQEDTRQLLCATFERRGFAVVEAGCDEYAVKPFDLARLGTVLNRHLPGRGGPHLEGGLTRRMTQTGLRVSTRSEAAGRGREDAPARRLFGLVEIDPAGTVLYARIEPDGSQQSGAAPDYAGLNFFREVAPFRNVAEFESHLDAFRRGSQPAHSMDFTCDYEDGPVLVRVLLARISERSQADVTKSVLVHIRRAQ